MQITLKQSEITSAIATYLTTVLGIQNVSPETLSVVYKQGRVDKNGMTAELDIEGPSYPTKVPFNPACSYGDAEANRVQKLAEAHTKNVLPVAEAAQMPAPVVAAAATEAAPEPVEQCEVPVGNSDPAPVLEMTKDFVSAQIPVDEVPAQVLDVEVDPVIDEPVQTEANEEYAEIAAAQAPVSAGAALFG